MAQEFVIYSRLKDGSIRREMGAAILAPSDITKCAFPALLEGFPEGFPEPSVMWSKETGPCFGIALKSPTVDKG